MVFVETLAGRRGVSRHFDKLQEIWAPPVSAASRQENNIQPPGFSLHHIWTPCVCSQQTRKLHSTPRVQPSPYLNTLCLQASRQENYIQPPGFSLHHIWTPCVCKLADRKTTFNPQGFSLHHIGTPSVCSQQTRKNHSTPLGSAFTISEHLVSAS